MVSAKISERTSTNHKVEMHRSTRACVCTCTCAHTQHRYTYNKYGKTKNTNKVESSRGRHLGVNFWLLHMHAWTSATIETHGPHTSKYLYIRISMAYIRTMGSVNMDT